MSGRVYLVSKAFDPFLGVITGVWAYALYERRIQRPEGHSLLELLRGKWDQRQRARQLSSAATPGTADTEGWEELTKELESAGGAGAAEGASLM